MWSYQLCASGSVLCDGENGESVSAVHVIFRGTPDDSAPWKRAYPKPLALNAALLGHRLESGDRGRVATLSQM